jgi:nuclear migration protein JNM1
LTLLDQQLATLSSATSLANLEAASTRIQRLRSEADKALSSPVTQNEDDEEAVLSPSDLTQLQQLYQLLPTLHSLSPTVPALLDRLRSLRTLHSTASTAASSLEAVEKRQSEMDAELKAWREGLEKLEETVREAGESNGRNGKVVEGWVRELEGRMKAVGGR